MEMVSLRTFLAVIEEGGIQAASRKLNTVQSNVTSRIKRLEEELGNTLFYREGRRLRLAPAGRVLQGYAERILSLAQQTKNAVNQVGHQTGELRIGSMETFAAVRLPPILKQVRNVHRGLNLKVETHTSKQLVELVRTHKLDCAFVGGPVDHPNLVSDIVLREELVLISALEFESEHLPLILFREGCAYRARALDWQRECGHPDIEVMELGTLDGILGCVAIGLGRTLMPSWVVDSSLYADQLRIEKLPDHIAHIPTVLIRHRDIPPLTAILTLHEAVPSGED